MQNHQNTPNSQSNSQPNPPSGPQPYQPTPPTTLSFLSRSYDYLFDTTEDKALVDCLTRYLITGDQPVTTPTEWQDVAIYIRYLKRDVWTLSDDQFDNAKRAIFIYRIKYIIEHLSKPDILECLNKFYTQKNSPHPKIASPLSFFNQKFHAPVDPLFLTQEKLIIDKQELKTYDKLFAYPCWLEFTDAALDEIKTRILKNKLTDEQLDYFLGATDDLKHYDKWLKIAKHILTTTSDPHVFWTAGDILAIIRRAVPTDKKSQKWFNDQLFEIFWPRVGSTWPLEHEDLLIDDTYKTQILTDSISWLHTIKDVKDRLPELKDDFEIYDFNTDDADFKTQKSALLELIKNSTFAPTKALDLFFTLADTATSPKAVKELQDFAEIIFIPYIKTTNLDQKEATSLINKALKHAESYQQTLTHERQNLAKLIN